MPVSNQYSGTEIQQVADYGSQQKQETAKPVTHTTGMPIETTPNSGVIGSTVQTSVSGQTDSDLTPQQREQKVWDQNYNAGLSGVDQSPIDRYTAKGVDPNTHLRTVAQNAYTAGLKARNSQGSQGGSGSQGSQGNQPLPADSVIQTLATQVSNPQLPEGTTFTPTQQAVGANELLTSPQQATGQTVQAQQISGPTSITVPMVQALRVGNQTPEIQAALGNVRPEDLVTAAQSAGIPDIEIPQILRNANINPAVIDSLPEIQAIQGQLSQAAQATPATASESPAYRQAIQEEQDRLINYPVDPNSTVQQQYTNLMSGVTDGSTPPWAAAAVRAAEQKLAARGLGGSSIAAEGITSALMQAALPIASADAKVFQTMDLEKFDKTSALGVLRASHIASLDLNNLQNQQQASLQNAQSALQVDLTNMNNAQQVAIQNAQNALTRATTNTGYAQQAAIEEARQNLQIDTSNLDSSLQARIENAKNSLTIETANLSARQQAQVQNAQAFLSMDMSNLDRSQQAAIVNSQARLQTLLSDQAATNVARNLNTQNILQNSQFMADLGQRAQEFNAAQQTSIDQFNSTMDNQRQQFNITNSLAIQQSNVDYFRRVNTANTSIENQANLVNAQNALGISNAAMANLVTLARDREAFNFQSSQNAQERALRRGIAELQANTNLQLQSNEQQARNSSWLGSLASDVVGGILGNVFGGSSGSSGSSSIDYSGAAKGVLDAVSG